MKRMLTYALLLPLANGCFWKKGGDSAVQGTLASISPSSTIQGNTPPTISVVGQVPDGFAADFVSEGFGSRRVDFKVKGLDSSSTYVFEVAQSGLLDPAVSFPYVPADGAPLLIAAIPAGTMALIYDAAPVGVDSSSRGVIMGQLSVDGTGCSPAKSIRLISASGGTSAANGPYYFNASGDLVTGQFSDPECTYVFVNVPQGNYVVQSISEFSSVVAETSVTAFPGKVAFGLDLP